METGWCALEDRVIDSNTQRDTGREGASDQHLPFVFFLFSCSYTKASDLDGYPYWGQLALYAGGGYVVPLKGSKTDLIALMNELEQNQWIDRYTRAVFVEFTTYNAQVRAGCFVPELGLGRSPLEQAARHTPECRSPFGRGSNQIFSNSLVTHRPPHSLHRISLSTVPFLYPFTGSLCLQSPYCIPHPISLSTVPFLYPLTRSLSLQSPSCIPHPISVSTVPFLYPFTRSLSLQSPSRIPLLKVPSPYSFASVFVSIAKFRSEWVHLVSQNCPVCLSLNNNSKAMSVLSGLLSTTPLAFFIFISSLFLSSFDAFSVFVFF